MSKSGICWRKKERISPECIFASETPFRFPRENQSASQVLQEELGLSGPPHWIC